MPPLPPSTSPSLPSLSVTNSVVTDSGKQVALQTAICIIVTLAVVAIICGTILLIWNDDWTAAIRRLFEMDSVPSSSTLVQWMIDHFFTALFSRPSRTSDELPRAHSIPLSMAPPSLRDYHLAAPRPEMARDSGTSHIPAITSIASSYPPSQAASPSFPNVIGSAGSAP